MAFRIFILLQINEAKKERNKAILSKEDYKARCKAADEKLRDMKADKEAVKKQLMRKVGFNVDTVTWCDGANCFLCNMFSCSFLSNPRMCRLSS